MIKAPIPANDNQRVQELHDLEILDTPEEDEFTDIVELASRICNTPISLISLVDSSRQWFKAKIGVDAAETPRDISFCGHAIVMDNDFFEVPDALKDVRFLDNPLVTGDPNIRYYAGVQLISRKGFRIGMLCVNDTKPNKLNDEQIFALKVLGNHVAKLLDLRITKKQSEEKTKKMEAQNEALKKIVSIIAHDVRGPLGSLKQIFELSEADMLDEVSRHELFSLSKHQVENILILLNNLIDWGKIKIGKPDKSVMPVNLKKIVDDEIDTITLAAALKNNTLLNFVDETAVFKGNPDMVKFIIRNLLTNANKFTKEGKIISFSDKDDQYTKLTVNDTGTGMTQHMIETLLHGKQTVTTPGTDNEKGSGLGFKLIREFMENIGGKIDMLSEVGKGSSVILYFPKEKSER